MPYEQSTGTYFEIHGEGMPLFIGHPHHVSLDDSLPGYLDRLTDRYRVLVVDYPSLGKSKTIPPQELTADRCCADLLTIADAVGFDRFAWWGYSWGGVIGLQLATRTDRLTALICGGWPPLGAQYAEILKAVHEEVTRHPLSDPTRPDYERMVYFYESIRDWPEDASVRTIQCPRMTYVGADDTVEIGGVTVEIAPPIQRNRKELESEGWRVVEIPGRDHSVFEDPATVVPPCREFLDAVT